MKKKVVIVIPIHQDEPSKFEKVSLAQTLSVLGKRPITFQTKEGVNTQWYEDFCRGKATVTFERFKWNGAQEYNNLLALPEFYRASKNMSTCLSAIWMHLCFAMNWKSGANMVMIIYRPLFTIRNGMAFLHDMEN